MSILYPKMSKDGYNQNAEHNQSCPENEDTATFFTSF